MENGNNLIHSFNNTHYSQGHFLGLTKREYFAGQIATGLSVQAIAGGHNSLSDMEISVPMYAVRIADALLKELDKPKSE